jgi:hypothetical protein
MTMRSRSASWLLLAAAAAPSIAQAPPAAMTAARTPIHTAPADADTPYGVWAAGERYKASFHDGARFVPYLGRDYPHTQSLQWRTKSARLGDRELCTQAPRLSHGEYRAEYDLGGLVEAYDVRTDGLEQTFVLPERTGAGELVIAGELTTALRARPIDPGHRDVVFVDADDRPILGYGAATAIDANGDTLPLVTTVGDGTLTLRVPAEWLANATFPVVVDPLLSVFWSEGGVQLDSIDLLRDDSLNKLWLAMSRWVSASDADLWLRRADDDGGNATTLFTDLTNSWSSTEPSLGQHFGSGMVLLAYTRRTFTGTQRLRAHVHDRTDATFAANTFGIGDNTLNAWRPDVANNMTAGASSLLVVWQSEGTGFPHVDLDDSRIHGAAVSLAGTGAAGAPFVIAADPAVDHERPQVGTINTTNLAWPVVYQQIDSGLAPSAGFPDWCIALRRVDATGVAGAVTFVNGTSPGVHRMGPRLAGRDSPQAVCWTSATPALAGPRPTDVVGSDVRCRIYQWNGAAWSAPNIGNYVNYNLDLRVVVTGFEFDSTTRAHYGITYRSTVTDNVYFEVLGHTGAEVGEATVFTPAAGQIAGAGAVAFDDDDDHFVIAYERTQLAGASDVRLVRFAQPTAAAPVVDGLGCSAAQLGWSGSQLVGAAYSRVTLGGVAPGALMTVAMAMAPFNQPLVGVPNVQNGCWLLVPNAGPDHLGFFSLAFGPDTQWTLPLPEFLPAMTLHFQGFHFDATNTTVSTTQRLSVPIVK